MLSLSELTHLEVLELPSNHMFGSIPDEPWSALVHLRNVSLQMNALMGTIPNSMGDLHERSTLSFIGLSKA